ncbi:hypothetical protein WBK50_28005 [Pseudonocardia sp. T1-2H]|uniref:hypothetical protein n=1 Tax=Pseudonocardia sp. T1-2H TaxID=3128899 RepID=UPI0031013078
MGVAVPSTIAVRRARREVPPMPTGELPVEPPPEPERIVPGGILNRLIPAATMLGSIGFVAVMGVDNPTSWLFGGMFALSSIGMLVSGAGGRGDRTATLDEDRRDYLRYLGLLRGRVRAVADAQRTALESAHPPPSAWPAVLAAGRLWERRASDEDFCRLRVGLGAQRLATRLSPPRTGPVDGLEPVTALALRRFLVRHTVVPALPVAVDLAAGPTGTALWLEGEDPSDLDPARALARALVVQYALWHSPADALLAVLAPASLVPQWEWVKWLPHNAHPRREDALGPIRMISGDGDDVRRWWLDEGAGHSGNLLLIVDGAASPGAWASSPGVTVLRVGAPPGRRAAPSVVRLLVGPSSLAGPGRSTVTGSPTRSPPPRRSRSPVGSPATGLPTRTGATVPRITVRTPPRACPSCSGCPPGSARRPSTRSAGAGAARPRTGCASRSAWTPRAVRSCWTSRSPRRAAAARTGSAWAPPDPGRASCCAPWSSG